MKYHVEIPKALHAELRDHATRYVPPLYTTYRDDNLR